MGREAVVQAEVAGRLVDLKALLEASELILRAPISRRIPIRDITEVVVDGDALRLRCGEEPLVLHLGERAAHSWAKAILTPPPTLRDKLGLSDGATAIMVGETDDPALLAATQDSLTSDRRTAGMIIACIHRPDDVVDALAILASGPPVPMWAVYPKGRNVAFGDSAIRDALRREGMRDTKTCAVSAVLTATRYHPGRS
ncbi:hypothetical protein [Microbacterium sp. SORGH_AS_0888]|uniref:hypothetical protein n=1 Tax=Microbacterium sp. SORGH_AS_0888 TaxID=3041791 RepID=UPI0027842F0E|nr:hypothetical protein [Microbacterium sp. SORGH_AS_0888]MDQ1130699.1 hypothetical protein [Microbacterium sp. SORGH_AS_0888]